MTKTPTPEDVERLERVARWDGDAAVCAWCGEELAMVCIDHEPVCGTCHTVAYERALIAHNRALSARVAELERERDEAREWSRKMVEMVEKAAPGGTLDGYREMGAKIAHLEKERDEFRALAVAAYEDAARIRREERERCLQLVEEYRQRAEARAEVTRGVGKHDATKGHEGQVAAAVSIAAAIRERED